ncbi:guanylate kinase [Trichinella spiralis]|uniref:guanylate kinase n=1 Tax=Trichinella spiralis TaxID=6334 RepID=UPI0001EFCFC1|nr:guanylate kinase [Trichinella spiralis]
MLQSLSLASSKRAVSFSSIRQTPLVHWLFCCRRIGQCRPVMMFGRCQGRSVFCCGSRLFARAVVVVVVVVALLSGCSESGTTRKPKPGEIDGVDYRFVTKEQFLALERNGDLLESGGFEGKATALFFLLPFLLFIILKGKFCQTGDKLFVLNAMENGNIYHRLCKHVLLTHKIVVVVCALSCRQ